MGDCCQSVLRYVVFIINLLVWIVGLAMLGVALFLRFDGKEALPALSPEEGAGQHYYTMCYVLMGAGGLLVISGFLGLCGAFKENRCVLSLYIFLLLCIVIAEVVAGAIVFKNREMYEKSFSDILQDAVLKKYGVSSGDLNEGRSVVTKLLDYVQKNNHCCGARGSSDYASSAWFKGRASSLPPYPTSCCEDGNCKVTVYDIGCGPMLMEMLKENIMLFIIIVSSTVALQVLALVLSTALCCCINRRYSGYTA